MPPPWLVASTPKFPLHSRAARVTSARSPQGPVLVAVTVRFPQSPVPLCDTGRGEIPAPTGGLGGVGRGRGWRGGGPGGWVAEFSMYR